MLNDSNAIKNVRSFNRSSIDVGFTRTQLAPKPTIELCLEQLASILLVLISLITFNNTLSAQTEVPKIDSISAKQENAGYPDMGGMKLPEYIDGEVGLRRFIAKHLGVVGEEAVEGTVVVAYSVTPEGKVIDIEVKRGLTDATNREAMRVVGLLQYKPFDHTLSTKPVKMTLPIRFAQY